MTYRYTKCIKTQHKRTLICYTGVWMTKYNKLNIKHFMLC